VRVELHVNGQRFDTHVEPHVTLLRFLRDDAGATDVKYGCGEGVCGACTVLLDGAAVNACSVLAVQADGTRIETVAALSDNGSLHPLQQELVERGAVQCGFCTPGVVLGAIEAVRLAGNLCRCTGYGKIVDAVHAYGGRS
jgi:aerobic-type carbon monoxide dehydrogenase small subunit (CoxS/CutS family)